MPLPVDEILYRVEAIEGLEPGTREHENRVLFLKAAKCAELRGLDDCTFCGLWMFCDLVKAVANSRVGNKPVGNKSVVKDDGA